MIDLRFRELPHAIVCDGKEYELNTDFRVWLDVWFTSKEGGSVPLSSVFAGEIPESDYMDGITEFMRSENATPRHGNKEDEDIPFDYILDGDYIVASFWHAYGIDMTSIDYMHWHVFLALFIGLPADTKMAQIIGYRTWRKSSKKYEDSMAELKRAWSLPDIEKEKAKEEALAWADAMERGII